MLTDRTEAQKPPTLPAVTRTWHDPVLPSFQGISGKVGIFGGTFDPVHIAHIDRARLAKEALGLERVVFIPAAQNPLKANAPEATDEQRLAMLCDALEYEPGLYVSPMEFERDHEKSYTVETLRQILSEADPGIEIFMIFGADVLPDLHRWREVHEIFRLVSRIACLPRNDSSRADLDVLKAEFTSEEIGKIEERLLELPPYDMSATDVRDDLHKGIIPADLLPEPVAARIAREGIYQYQARKAPA